MENNLFLEPEELIDVNECRRYSIHLYEYISDSSFLLGMTDGPLVGAIYCALETLKNLSGKAVKLTEENIDQIANNTYSTGDLTPFFDDGISLFNFNELGYGEGWSIEHFNRKDGLSDCILIIDEGESKIDEPLPIAIPYPVQFNGGGWSSPRH